MDFFQLIKASCEDLGMEITERQYEQFVLYMKHLQEWNEKINLTSIIEDELIFKKHFIDCIKVFKFEQLLKSKNSNISVIDIGTGAGFPGIPMKIMEPNLKVTLLDSLNKRVNFLNSTISLLELDGIEAVHGRAEDFARNIGFRQKFDYAVSRAVASLPVLSEFSLPYVKVGGYFIALKGPAVEEEISNAKNAINLLGGKIEEIIAVDIEDTDLKHNIVVIRKEKSTPSAYPRKAGLINKNPLK